MDSMKESFELMLSALMEFVDMVNSSHANGVYFGTENRLYPAEIHTVVAIGENEGISVTKLAKMLNVSKPTLSERIQKLVTKGFVKKEKNPDDLKAVVLRLTPDGRTACHHHEMHHLKMYKVFCEHFGEESRETIELLTRTFNQALKLEKELGEHNF